MGFPCNQFAGQMPEGDGDEMICHLQKEKAEFGDIFAKVSYSIKLWVVSIDILNFSLNHLLNSFFFIQIRSMLMEIQPFHCTSSWRKSKTVSSAVQSNGISPNSLLTKMEFQLIVLLQPPIHWTSQKKSINFFKLLFNISFSIRRFVFFFLLTNLNHQ